MSPASLPTGWTYAVTGSNPASIVIPASGALVSHVLTSLKALTSQTNAATFGVALQVLDGVTVVFTWNLRIPDSVGPPITVGADSIDIPITIVGTPGNTMTIQFAAATPGATPIQEIFAEGYDL